MRVEGLCEQYESLSEFRVKFARQLAQTIISRFPTSADRATGSFVVDSPQIPNLGEPASELLVEASQDSQGIIMSLQTLQGSHVQTNGREFVQGGARDEARWRSAVAELDRLGLVEDRAGKNEVFFVTDKGYHVAELVIQS